MRLYLHKTDCHMKGLGKNVLGGCEAKHQKDRIQCFSQVEEFRSSGLIIKSFQMKLQLNVMFFPLAYSDSGFIPVTVGIGKQVFL